MRKYTLFMVCFVVLSVSAAWAGFQGYYKPEVRRLDYYERFIGGTITDNIIISNSAPELKLIDTDDGKGCRWKYSDVGGTMSLICSVNKPSGVGNALDFDGSDDRVSLGSLASLNFGSGDFTVSLWINPDDVGGTPRFISKRDNNNADGWDIGLSGSKLRGLAWFGATKVDLIDPSVISTGSYIHVVFRRSGNNWDLFKNNVSVASTTDSSSITSNSDIAYLSDTSGFTTPYNGQTDEVAVWLKGLSDNDISDLYAAGSGYYIDKDNNFPTDGGSIGTNLEVLLHLDETSGTTASDSSGNGNDGTLQNMTDADWVLGKISTTGADVEQSILEAKDGTGAGEGGIFTFGANDSRTVVDGQTIRYNIGGIEVGQIDASGTLVIDNGDSTAQQFIARAGASASENIQEWQDTSENILAYVDENGDSQFGNLIIGTAEAGIDYTLIFSGETNSGILTWLEDEDDFKFSDDILMDTAERIYFRATTQYVVSGAANELDLVSNQYNFFRSTSGGLTLDFANVNNTSVEFLVQDNIAQALDIKQGSNKYLTFVTTDGSEEVQVGENLETVKGRVKNTTRVTTTYTILVSDEVVFGNTDAGAFTATLPAGAEGQSIRVINSGSSSNNLTIAPSGAEHLLGANSSFVLFDGESLKLAYNSTDGWY